MKSPIEKLLDQVTWREVHVPQDHIVDGLPYATHEGMLKIPGVGEFRVHQLSNGERVIQAEDIERWLRE